MRRGVKLLLFTAVYALLTLVLYAIFSNITEAGVSGASGAKNRDYLGEFMVNQGLLILVAMPSVIALHMRMRMTAYGWALIIASQTVLLYGLLKILWDKLFLLGFGTINADYPFRTMGFIYQAVCGSFVAYGYSFGRIGILEIMVLNVSTVFFYSLNQGILRSQLKVNDPGGCMVIFLFGGCFALVLQVLVYRNRIYPPQSVSFDSAAMSLLGTGLAWITWPSFNAVLVDNKRAQSALYSTFLVLSVSIVSSYATLVKSTEKLSVQNVSRYALGSGIAVAASADIIDNQAASTVLGLLVPYLLIQIRGLPFPVLTEIVIPAIIGSLYSAIIVASYALLGYTLPETEFARFGHVPRVQIGIQIACMFIAALFGLLSGWVASVACNYMAVEQYEFYLAGECHGAKLEGVRDLAFYHDYAEWDIELVQVGEKEGSSRQFLLQV